MGDQRYKQLANLHLGLGIATIISGLLTFEPYISNIALIPVVALSIIILVKGKELKFDKSPAIVCLISATLTLLFGLAQVFRYDIMYYSYGIFTFVQSFFRVGVVVSFVGGILALINSSKINKATEMEVIEEFNRQRREREELKKPSLPIVEEPQETKDEIQATINLEESIPSASAVMDSVEKQDDAQDVIEEVIIEPVLESAEVNEEAIEEVASNTEEVNDDESNASKIHKELDEWQEMVIREGRVRKFKLLKNMYLVLIVLGIISVIPMMIETFNMISFGLASISAIVLSVVTMQKMKQENLNSSGPIFIILSQVFSFIGVIPIIVLLFKTIVLDYSRYGYYYSLQSDLFYNSSIGYVLIAVIIISSILAIVGVILCFSERAKVTHKEFEFRMENMKNRK